MTSTPILLEFTISGFIYLIGIIFLVLRVFQVKDFSFIPVIKDYLIPISIVGVGFAYVLGVLFHRASLILFPRFLKVLRFWRKESDKKQKAESSEFNQYDDVVFIWQYGSDRLFESLDYHNKTTSYFRALSTAFPFLGLSFSIWIATTNFKYLTWASLIIFLFLGLLSYIAYRDQKKRLAKINDVVIREVSLTRDKVLSSLAKKENSKKKMNPSKKTG